MQNLLFKFSILLVFISALNTSAQTDLINKTPASCATEAPDQQWENELNRLINEIVNSQSAKQQQAQAFTSR